MNIDALKSTIAKKGGLAKANRFQVIFTPPTQSLLNLSPETLVGNLASGKGLSIKNLINDPRDISLLCEQVMLPSRSISTLDYSADKQSNKFPYTNIDGDVNMTFILTSDMYIKSMFDNWTSSIIDMDSYNLGYKDDYSTDIVIQTLDSRNIPTYGVKLEKAYPTEISVIALNNTDGEYLRCTVTFAYDKYVVEGPLSSTASALRAAIPGSIL
jgi:hypothetical protein|tara:strand:- start:6726 stop:7364 length:639 start_codon:yes stop_codon:yes gene_type:complete